MHRLRGVSILEALTVRCNLHHLYPSRVGDDTILILLPRGMQFTYACLNACCIGLGLKNETSIAFVSCHVIK
jgi:hypothetical protein